ncbi:hypothetical protein PVK06_035240 [Gossypium arboreum]|uniref:Uncharacterized protein n=1 Tax=Gossypium arboreum TaxID=29729 RepID=A0ABR0NGB7_GOSAR|nr:hypothetical protein PVK06_035240 [Gossypium arboreum]
MKQRTRVKESTQDSESTECPPLIRDRPKWKQSGDLFIPSMIDVEDDAEGLTSEGQVLYDSPPTKEVFAKLTNKPGEGDN